MTIFLPRELGHLLGLIDYTTVLEKKGKQHILTPELDPYFRSLLPGSFSWGWLTNEQWAPLQWVTSEKNKERKIREENPGFQQVFWAKSMPFLFILTGLP